MKKLSKLTLHQLDKAELDKRQEGLLFGGGTPGECRCSSCTSSSEYTPISLGNRDANRKMGYISGGNNAECTCSTLSSTNIACTKPVF